MSPNPSPLTSPHGRSRLRRVLADWALILGVTLAVMVALRIGQDIAAPLLLAMIFGIVLSPLTDLGRRLGLPRALSAMVGLLITLAVLGLIGMALEPLVRELVDLAPKVWSDLREAIATARRALAEWAQMTDQVEEAVNPDQQEEGDAEGTSILPSPIEALSLAPRYAGQLLIFAGALFLFLLSREDLYGRVARMARYTGGPRDLGDRIRRAEGQVARYFLTILIINTGLGIATGTAMSLIGLPSAMTWGLVAGLFNFVLYVGPAVVAIGLLFAGIAAFDGAMTVVPPLAFLTLNMIEAQMVTPAFVGNRMRLNPLIVFVALVFWLWLWGPIGGFVAIPLLLWMMSIARPAGDGPGTAPQTISSGIPGNGRPHRPAGPGS